MKLGYRPKEAAEVLGSEWLLEECVAARWIQPKVQRNRLTIYDYSDLADCWRRICEGELPPVLVRVKKRPASPQAAMPGQGGACA